MRAGYLQGDDIALAAAEDIAPKDDRWSVDGQGRGFGVAGFDAVEIGDSLGKPGIDYAAGTVWDWVEP